MVSKRSTDLYVVKLNSYSSLLVWIKANLSFFLNYSLIVYLLSFIVLRNSLFCISFRFCFLSYKTLSSFFLDIASCNLLYNYSSYRLVRADLALTTSSFYFYFISATGIPVKNMTLSRDLEWCIDLLYSGDSCTRTGSEPFLNSSRCCYCLTSSLSSNTLLIESMSRPQ